MFGCTTNDWALAAVEPSAVTVIGPVVDPLGTTARIRLSDRTANIAGLPLNSTSVVSANPDPLTKTARPTGPLRGHIFVMEGVCAWATAGIRPKRRTHAATA